MRILRGLRLWPSLIGFLIVFGASGLSPLRAQITCSGTNCALIPLTPAEYNALFLELQNQYSTKLFNNIAETLVMANVAGPQIGSVNLHRFTVGGYGGGGFKETENIDVNIPGVGVLEDLPLSGAALNGGVYVGVNLGWVLGEAYDPFGEPEDAGNSAFSAADTGTSARRPGWLSPSRFDLYVGGMEHRERVENKYNVDGTLDGRFASQRYMLRYHLLHGREIAGGPLLRFRGVSLGVGYATSNQRVNYTAADSSLTLSLVEGVNLDWAARDKILIDNNVKSVPIEVSTGIQLLYILNLTLGAGYARSSGDTRFVLTRNGTVFVRAAGALPAIDEELLKGVPPETLAGLTGNSPSANLNLTLLERSKVPSVVHYWKGGLEFNFAFFRLGIEGITTGRNYGGSVNIRIEL